ncbi:hypothetical protein HK405_008809 [Cladochytrium tenue]|nr:hypothetical protein HK405_008809 [Cladochytrium tenue]
MCQRLNAPLHPRTTLRIKAWPPELLATVLAHLPAVDLKNCTLVARGWAAAASPPLLSRLRLASLGGLRQLAAAVALASAAAPSDTDTGAASNATGTSLTALYRRLATLVNHARAFVPGPDAIPDSDEKWTLLETLLAAAPCLEEWLASSGFGDAMAQRAMRTLLARKPRIGQSGGGVDGGRSTFRALVASPALIEAALMTVSTDGTSLSNLMADSFPRLECLLVPGSPDHTGLGASYLGELLCGLCWITRLEVEVYYPDQISALSEHLPESLRQLKLVIRDPSAFSSDAWSNRRVFSSMHTLDVSLMCALHDLDVYNCQMSIAAIINTTPFIESLSIVSADYALVNIIWESIRGKTLLALRLTINDMEHEHVELLVESLYYAGPPDSVQMGLSVFGSGSLIHVSFSTQIIRCINEATSRMRDTGLADWIGRIETFEAVAHSYVQTLEEQIVSIHAITCFTRGLSAVRQMVLPDFYAGPSGPVHSLRRPPIAYAFRGIVARGRLLPLQPLRPSCVGSEPDVPEVPGEPNGGGLQPTSYESWRASVECFFLVVAHRCRCLARLRVGFATATNLDAVAAIGVAGLLARLPLLREVAWAVGERNLREAACRDHLEAIARARGVVFSESARGFPNPWEVLPWRGW